MASVVEYLQGRGAPFLVLPCPEARRIEETAEMHGIAPAELVRTEVVIARSGPTLMVVPAGRFLDLEVAQKVLQDPGARPATHGELRSFAQDCDVNGIPPLSLYLLAPMVVDPAVADLPQLVFAAGRPSLLVCMQREDLFADDPFVVAPLTRESYVPEPLIAPSRRPVLTDEDLLPVHLAEHQRDRSVDVA